MLASGESLCKATGFKKFQSGSADIISSLRFDSIETSEARRGISLEKLGLFHIEGPAQDKQLTAIQVVFFNSLHKVLK